MSKKLINLLRHGNPPRDNDGAIEFWRIKDNLQKHFMFCHHWSTKSGRIAWQEEEETRKDFSIVVILQEKFFHLRALQGHSGRNLVDPSLQDNCCYSERFLPVHLSRWMCNQFTFHHQFRIDTGRTKFEQKTDGILHVCESYEQRTQRSGDN